MRALSPNLRRALEEPRSAEYIVILLRIDHETLSEPILVANDVVNYVVDGETYFGFPFATELLGDNTSTPRGQLAIQNVDRRISEAVLALTTPPSLAIIMYAQSDFSEVMAASPNKYEDTRFLLDDTTQPEYLADFLMFGNITIDAMQVTGEILSFDMTNEPWPAIRSTADRLPGLQP